MVTSILWTVPTALIIGMLALYWPHRRERRFTLRRFIRAPRERIWELYFLQPDNPAAGYLVPSIVSESISTENANVVESVVDVSGGHRTQFARIRTEVLSHIRPTYYASRTIDLAGRAYPFGDRNLEVLALSECQDGTCLRLSFQGETASLGQLLQIWLNMARLLHRLRKISEGLIVDQASKGRRALRNCFLVLGLTVVSFGLMIGWPLALLLVAVLILHEFGHWLAMRLTGQPAPRILLVPFLGGLAAANHPHRTLLDDAFCSLMGPGFSAFVGLAAIQVAGVSGEIAMTAATDPSTVAVGSSDICAVLSYSLASMIAMMNLIQLLPILPLDGGQVLRAVTQSFGQRPAYLAGMLLAAVGIAGAILLNNSFLIVLCSLGAIQAHYIGREAPTAKAMDGVAVTAVGLGYFATITIHMLVLAQASQPFVG